MTQLFLNTETYYLEKFSIECKKGSNQTLHIEDIHVLSIKQVQHDVSLGTKANDTSRLKCDSAEVTDSLSKLNKKTQYIYRSGMVNI